MRSLFIRMRFVHWLGVIILVMNALFLTENITSQILQGIVVIFLIIHDIDAVSYTHLTLPTKRIV